MRDGLDQPHTKSARFWKLHGNRRGLIGWFDSRHLNLERYFYSLHRLCGVILVGYLFVHVYTTATRLRGVAPWNAFLHTIENPLIYAGEWLLVAVVAFHGLNGIRLILAEVGLSIGEPQRPIYPYKPESLGRRQRFLILLLMIVGGFLLAGAALEYLVFVSLAITVR
jgi:succinate dehydrogenase / fumarate reductase, cytochrome b subunit